MSTKSHKIVATLLTHLKNSGDLELLPEIVAQLTHSSEYGRSVHKVILTSATKFESSHRKTIEAYVKKQLGHAYDLREVIDPSLVGGFTLQINDTLIDASVLGKINSLQAKLAIKD